MKLSDKLQELAEKSDNTWLITGVGGFIGSNLLEALLTLNQKVVGLDNFATGKKSNLDEVKNKVGPALWQNFTFTEGDIRDLEVCKKVCAKATLVLHQAALGSVPRSIKNPVETHQVNVSGFLNILVSSQEAGVKKFVYASSSSVYGDNPDLPKVEDNIGKPLSPYAAGKLMNEIYAGVFSALHNFTTIGLRYFNVFGPRQDPDGQYAAVIPRWIKAVVNNEPAVIYGDGKTSRDFCFISNVIEANLLAALSDSSVTGSNCVLNIANHATTSLTDLFNLIKSEVSEQKGAQSALEAEYKDFRPGDIRHSLADIKKASELIAYKPQADIKQGMKETVEWFLK